MKLLEIFKDSKKQKTSQNVIDDEHKNKFYLS